jgi:hypothetical protein
MLPTPFEEVAEWAVLPFEDWLVALFEAIALGGAGGVRLER